MKEIYTITTMADISNSRCIGWFSKFEYAENEILNNTYDMYEGMYRYAIIEKVNEGLYGSFGTDLRITFYEWDKNLGCYLKLDGIPISYKQMCGLGIG